MPDLVARDGASSTLEKESGMSAGNQNKAPPGATLASVGRLEPISTKVVSRKAEARDFCSRYMW